MRIRYNKPGGKEIELPTSQAKRLIASGAAVEVKAKEPAKAAPEPAAHATAAKSTSRSR